MRGGMSGSTRGTLYIDKVLENWLYTPGTKTFNSVDDGSLWRIKQPIGGRLLPPCKDLALIPT
jgi:hypothetical protein